LAISNKKYRYLCVGAYDMCGVCQSLFEYEYALDRNVRYSKEGVVRLISVLIPALPQLSAGMACEYKGVLSVVDRECAGNSTSTER